MTRSLMIRPRPTITRRDPASTAAPTSLTTVWASIARPVGVKDRSARPATIGGHDDDDLPATPRPHLPRLWHHAFSGAPRLLLCRTRPRGRRHASCRLLRRLVLAQPL